eukprot:UN03550
MASGCVFCWTHSNPNSPPQSLGKGSKYKGRQLNKPINPPRAIRHVWTDKEKE